MAYLHRVKKPLQLFLLVNILLLLPNKADGTIIPDETQIILTHPKMAQLPVSRSLILNNTGKIVVLFPNTAFDTMAV